MLWILVLYGFLIPSRSASLLPQTRNKPDFWFRVPFYRIPRDCKGPRSNEWKRWNINMNSLMIHQRRVSQGGSWDVLSIFSHSKVMFKWSRLSLWSGRPHVLVFVTELADGSWSKCPAHPITLMPFGRYFVSRRQIMPAIMETTLEQQQIPTGGPSFQDVDGHHPLMAPTWKIFAQWCPSTLGLPGSCRNSGPWPN